MSGFRFCVKVLGFRGLEHRSEKPFRKSQKKAHRQKTKNQSTSGGKRFTNFWASAREWEEGFKSKSDGRKYRRPPSRQTVCRSKARASWYLLLRAAAEPSALCEVVDRETTRRTDGYLRAATECSKTAKRNQETKASRDPHTFTVRCARGTNS